MGAQAVELEYVKPEIIYRPMWGFEEPFEGVCADDGPDSDVAPALRAFLLRKSAEFAVAKPVLLGNLSIAPPNSAFTSSTKLR